MLQQIDIMCRTCLRADPTRGSEPAGEIADVGGIPIEILRKAAAGECGLLQESSGFEVVGGKENPGEVTLSMFSATGPTLWDRSVLTGLCAT
jgi:hypothetical protein